MLTILLGHVTLDLLVLALRMLALPIITIVSLMVITLAAERAGLFDVLARRLALAAAGSGWRLFSYIFAAGTLAGVLFSNDSAVLIFTPLVYQLIERVQDDSWTLRNKIPFYFAVLYVANVVGVLVTSNPINVVVASLFQISFSEYARWMFLPATASIIISYAGLALVFRKSVPRRYDVTAIAPVRHERGPLIFCAIVLCVTLAGFFSESWTGIPTWLVACAGALTTLLAWSRRPGHVPAIMRGVSWDVLIFVAGIFVVVAGLREAGLTRHIGTVLAYLAGQGTLAMTTGTSLAAGLCSSIANNHPTAYLMAWAIRDLGAPAQETKLLAFAALIGGDLGPKMLPIGSLAALIWFRMLRARGVEIPYSLYVRIGVPVSIAAILAAVLILNLELALL